MGEWKKLPKFRSSSIEGIGKLVGQNSRWRISNHIRWFINHFDNSVISSMIVHFHCPDKNTQMVWINGEQADVEVRYFDWFRYIPSGLFFFFENEFTDGGAEILFSVGESRGTIRSYSTGRKELGIQYILYVNDTEINREELLSNTEATWANTVYDSFMTGVPFHVKFYWPNCDSNVNFYCIKCSKKSVIRFQSLCVNSIIIIYSIETLIDRIITKNVIQFIIYGMNLL